LQNHWEILQNHWEILQIKRETLYLRETGFSTIAVMKIKYRSRLVVENELRVAASYITLRFEKMCAENQTHLSN
jgi:hypothetical protein